MLAYRIIGQGQPLVLLHGFLSDGRDFDNLVAHLKVDFQCILVDLAGHGQSSDVMVTSINELVRHIIKILIMENITCARIYGYSMGGRVALQLACDYPQFCQQLILESASPGIQQLALREQRKQDDTILAEKITTNYLQFLTDWRQQNLFLSQKKLPREIQCQQLAINLSQVPQAIAQSLLTYGTGVQLSLWDKLSQLKISCLLLVGSLDIKFVNIAQEMYQLCPQYIKLIVVDEAGHNIHLEQPQQIIRILKKERTINERMD